MRSGRQGQTERQVRSANSVGGILKLLLEQARQSEILSGGGIQKHHLEKAFGSIVRKTHSGALSGVGGCIRMYRFEETISIIPPEPEEGFRRIVRRNIQGYFP